MPAVLSRGLGKAIRQRLARRRRAPSAGRLTSGGAMWTALGSAFAAVTVLGAAGFTRYQEAGVGDVDPLGTRVYRSIQLFVLESGAVSGNLPWELQVARFAAPLVAVYAIVQTLAAVFRDQVESLRLQVVRDHVVVAGLGRKGARLAHALLERGDRVVVIEADRQNPGLENARSLGALVIGGDARAPETQRRARVAHARHLVALCGDDRTNTEIVACAREQVAARRAGTLQCVADLADPDLGLLLSSEELERYGQASVRVDFVNTYAVGAQALLRAHPPVPAEDGAAPSVLVVGARRTAEHLLVALARTSLGEAATHPGGWAPKRLDLTVAGPDADNPPRLADLPPDVERLATVRAVESYRAVLAAGAPAATYICPDDDDAAATIALELRSMLAGQSTRIVVVLQEGAGLGRLLRGAPRPTGGPDLVTFGLLDEVCDPDVLLTGTTEVLARALHRSYVDARGGESPGDPSLRPWSALPDTLRESNRDQAAHIAVKLAAVHRTVAPLFDPDAALAPLGEDDVEVMARLEHDRWVAERRRAGWRPGPRDPERRTTPYLVPWVELTEEIRERDRVFVRELPRLLASVGLQAVEAGTAWARPVPEGEDRHARGSSASARGSRTVSRG